MSYRSFTPFRMTEELVLQQLVVRAWALGPGFLF
jgi:hypothetical protein